MNISNREKVLLFIMLAALLLFLSYSFLLKPRLDGIAQAEIDIAAAQEQKSSLDITSAGKTAVDEKINELNTKLEEVMVSFYPNLETKAILKFLNNSVMSAGLDPAAIRLSLPSLSYPYTGTDAVDAIEDYELYDMAQKIAGSQAQPINQGTTEQAEQPLRTLARDADISFSGNLAQLREFISILERQNKSIVISSFNFERDEIFEGNIAFAIYALPKPIEDTSGFPAY